MKKIFLITLLLIAMSGQAFAMKKVTSQKLKISGVPITDTVINGVTVTSDSVYQTGNVGFSALLTKVSGSINISYQVSNDNSNWYTPYTTDGSTLTSAGAIATAVTADRWIILTARMAPYIRFIFVSAGSSTISSTAIWQNDN